jgi:predicted  nucleic acid-binding Zn-ribbon protein
VSAEVERLQAQHADAVREKSAAESKSRRLAEKVAALEGERTDLRRQLVEEWREANQAIAAAQAEAKLARAEGSLASQRWEHLEGGGGWIGDPVNLKLNATKNLIRG